MWSFGPLRLSEQLAPTGTGHTKRSKCSEKEGYWDKYTHDLIWSTGSLVAYGPASSFLSPRPRHQIKFVNRLTAASALVLVCLMLMLNTSESHSCLGI